VPEISSTIELYDSDIIKIDKGPIPWAVLQQGSRRNLEGFRKGLTEQFNRIGLVVYVSCYTTDEDGTYAFDVEIRGRTESHEFDFDRQVHEVTNNLLDEPGVEKGFVKTPAWQKPQKHRH
jgi:hypothetical protein